MSASLLRSYLAVFVASLAAWGCADGGGGTNAGDASVDAGPTPDAGRRDGGSVVVNCPAGQHRCGNGCIGDLANDPANGCRLGCGVACMAPPDGEAACDANGTCTFACEPPFTRVGDQCTCARRTCAELGFQCGAPDDGCGTPLDCGGCDGGTCTNGRCACPRDPFEPNETLLAADGLDPVAEVPNENWNQVYTNLGLHDVDDVDVLRFRVADSGLFNGEPDITVTLSDIAAGANYDLVVSWVCDGSPERSECRSGEQEADRGRTCASRRSGQTTESVRIGVECRDSVTTNTDDSGTLYVRVLAREGSAMCANYRLEVDVKN